MKKYYLFLFLLGCSLWGFGQKELRLDWSADAYGFSNDFYAVDVVTDASDNIYSLGTRFNSDWDVILTKYDANGNELWNQIYDGGGTEKAAKLGIDAFNNLYILAQAGASGGDNKYQVVKYNSAGSLQWVSEGNGGIAGIYGNNMTVDDNGNAYVTGTQPQNTTQYNMFVEKFNSSGTSQWKFTDNVVGYKDGGTAITVDNSGNVYFTGYYSLSSGETNWMTTKLNSSGTEQWDRWYNGANSNSDTATAIVVDGSGNVYVAGKAENSSKTSEYLDFEKLNSSGVVQWVERLTVEIVSDPIMKMDGLSNLYVSAAEYGGGGASNNSALLYQYSNSGTQNWASSSTGYYSSFAPGELINFPKDVLVDEDSSAVYLCYAGSCNSGDPSQYGQGVVIDKMDLSTGVIQDYDYDRFTYYADDNSNPAFPEPAPAEGFAFLQNKDAIASVASHPDDGNYTRNLRTIKTNLFEDILIAHEPTFDPGTKKSFITLCRDDSIQMQPANIPSGATVKWESTFTTNRDYMTEYFSDRNDPNAWLKIPNNTNTAYQLEVHLAGGDSVHSYEVRVKNEALDTGIVAHGPTSFCNGDSVWVSLDAGEENGTNQIFWFTTASDFTAPGTFEDSVLVKHTGYYWAEITNGISGCSAVSDSIYISTNGPNIDLGADTAVCSDDTPLSLDAGGPYSSYSWSTGATSQSISVSSTGQYSVEVTDGAGCVGQDTIDLTVNPNPSVNLGSDQSLCAYETTTLDAGSGFSNYAWNTGASSQSITVSSNGTFEVTVTNSSGCQATDQVNVSYFSAVSVNLNTADATCGNANGAAGVALATGSPTASFTWSTGDSGDTLSNLAAGSYEVYTEDGNGCKDTTSFSLQNLAAPSLNQNSQDVTCVGGSDGYATVSVNSGNGPFGFSWNTGSTADSIGGLSAGSYSCTVTDTNGCQTTANYTLSEVNPLPSVTISGDTSYCEGGATTLDAGSGFVDYSWSDGSSNQALTVSSPGSYHVRVTDGNGCENADTVSISEDPLPSVTITGDTTYCPGSSTTLDAGNGFSGYSWSDGSSNQTLTTSTTGSVSVTVTDNNGCQAGDQVVLDNFPAVSVDVTTNDESCGNGDGSAGVSLNTGGSPASFSWSTGDTGDTLSGLAAGVYEVYTEDGNGCKDTTSLTINSIGGPQLDSSKTDVNCVGGSDGSASITVISGTSPYSYQWNTGATGTSVSGLSAGSYSCTVTDSLGCQTIQNFNLIELNPLPAVDLGADTVICQGATLTLDPGSFSSYLWNDGSSGQTYDVTTTGDYSVEVTDNNGCSNADTIGVTTTICTGISENASQPEVRLMPNPTRGPIMLKGDVTRLETIQVFGPTGKRVKSLKMQGPIRKIDLTDLPDGIYMILLNYDHGNRETERMIKR